MSTTSLGTTPSQLTLYLHRAPNGVDHAPKLGQDGVTHIVHDPSPMLFDHSPEDRPVLTKALGGGDLVFRHETAEAIYVGAEDGR